MSKSFLLIRFFGDDSTEWARFGPDGGRLDGPHGGLPPGGGEDRVIVLVPGEAVLLMAATVPTRNPGKLRRALPFALEDRLVGDVAELHVVPGPRDGEGRVSAAVVARRRMDEWLSTLAKAGLSPDAMLPEPMALPGDGTQAGVVLEDGRVIARTGRQSGFACESDLAPALLERTAPDGIDVHRVPEAEKPPAGLPDGRPLQEPVLCWLARGVNDAGPDLLYGDYRPRHRAGAAGRMWLAAAVLFLAWGTLEIGLAAADYWRLKSANRALDARITQVFRDTFPDQPVRDPAAQMRQQIRLLGGGDASGTELLSRVAPVLSQAVNVRLQALEYRDNRLLVTVKADNIGALDALRNALAASGPYEVELASATRTESGVDGRLAVSGGGA